MPSRKDSFGYGVTIRLGMRLLNDVPRVRAEYLFWDEIVRADARRVAGRKVAT